MGKAATLYRSILRAHRSHLPPEMRSLGDTYVRKEFQMHKTATQSEHVAGFYTAWESYLGDILRQGDTGGGYGKDLPQDVAISKEQAEQLDQLKQEVFEAEK